MILNEDLKDEQLFRRLLFQNGLSSMAKAFHGKPRKTLLDPGRRLFRMATLLDCYPFRGVWWMSEAVYAALLTEAGGDRAKFLKIARDHLAVKMTWSPGMRHIIEIRLTQPVYAWVGPAREQKESIARMKHVVWNGGAEQIFLPNLSDAEYLMASRWATLESTYVVNVDYDPQADPEYA
ncbi:MAG: hypothetical protein IT167_22870 [Bryobacterales bacterium]|nr:hypothetical protein [Bryobacterales bacterium]